VPAAALGDPGVLGRRPVTLPLPDGVPPGVAVGSRLEVWASPRERDAGTGARYGKVRRIVTDTEVFAVTSNDETLSVGRPALVQVLLPQADIGRVLDALANEDKIALVPVGAAAP